MSDYSETELLELAKDILAKPGAMSKQDVLELDEIGRQINERRTMDTKHCAGCEDDFYNGHNPYGVKECWMLKDAKVITRFGISVDSPMGDRKNFCEEQLPQCYRRKRFVFVKEIPNYAI